MRRHEKFEIDNKTLVFFDLTKQHHEFHFKSHSPSSKNRRHVHNFKSSLLKAIPIFHFIFSSLTFIISCQHDLYFTRLSKVITHIKRFHPRHRAGRSTPWSACRRAEVMMSHASHSHFETHPSIYLITLY